MKPASGRAIHCLGRDDGSTWSAMTRWTSPRRAAAPDSGHWMRGGSRTSSLRVRRATSHHHTTTTTTTTSRCGAATMRMSCLKVDQQNPMVGFAACTELPARCWSRFHEPPRVLTVPCAVMGFVLAGELREVNQHAEALDHALAAGVAGGRVYGVVAVSADVTGVNLRVVAAACQARVPVVGTGGVMVMRRRRRVVMMIIITMMMMMGVGVNKSRATCPTSPADCPCAVARCRRHIVGLGHRAGGAGHRQQRRFRGDHGRVQGENAAIYPDSSGLLKGLPIMIVTPGARGEHAIYHYSLRCNAWNKSNYGSEVVPKGISYPEPSASRHPPPTRPIPCQALSFAASLAGFWGLAPPSSLATWRPPPLHLTGVMGGCLPAYIAVMLLTWVLACESRE
jgi:hypothetical protein